MDWALDLFDADAVAAARAEVAIDEPWRLIERFSTLIRESGSEDERISAQYMCDRLESFGIEPTVYEPELYLSVPRSCSLAVVGDDPVDLECKVPAFSRPTGDTPLEGELAAVATGEIRDTADLFKSEAGGDLSHVAGKIALASGYAMPKIVGQLADAGAAGAIFVNPGHAHEGIITSVWGIPGISDRDRIPDFTVICVPAAVGKILGERLAAGACRVRIQTDLFHGWARCPVVVADIPGDRDEFVFIHGHYDSWHEGIGDNAVGDAALLEVARVAHANRDRLRRGIRVAWWPGHSTGRYAGSTWYADEMAMDLRDRCVAQIDVDSPGCRWATEYDQVMWMAEAEGLARACIRAGAGKEAKGIRPLRAGDYSFNQVGLTGFFMLLSNVPAELAAEKGFYPVGGCGGNSDAWHTEGDTFEVADQDNLLRDIHVYVEAVMRLSTATALPFDYRATAREIADACAGYGEAAAGQFDMSEVLAQCAALVADLDALYARGREAAGAGVAGFNRAQMRLARELVSVGYARRRFYHDPALETPAVPDLAILRDWGKYAADADGRRFLLAEAKRGRNRVVDALKRAREHVAAAS